jgi:hypothetical protein
MTALAQALRSATLPVDRVAAATLLLLAALAVADSAQALDSLRFTLDSLLWVAPFLAASVAIAGYAKASGLDQQAARVFAGRPLTTIALAAAFGALSPFCSCGVVPVVAGLLGAGVPLAPVMSFWIASPLMDPEMFLLTLGVFGLQFTLAKTAAAVALGLVAGYATHLLVQAGAFPDPLKATAKGCGSGCGGPRLSAAEIEWRIWAVPARRSAFLREARSNGWFLGKWLTLAFLVESLMLAWVPAAAIGQALGGGAWWSVPAAVLAGVPAYLNGYAAIPTVDALIDLGMAPGAGLAFMLAGGVSSIPAAMAVFALVKRGVFAWYLALGAGGALVAGVSYQLLA